MAKRRLGIVLAGAVLFFAGLQVAQPERTNPPADPSAGFAARSGAPPAVATTLMRACKDCHSNQTVWPWYSHISPVSWMVAGDVRRGRAQLNLSEWNLYSPEVSRLRLGEICEVVKAGRMPLGHYKMMHPEAKLSAEEVSALCAAAK
jgi:hypothetical protein